MKFILLFLISLPAFAGYFTDHVKESIVINKERKIFYSELSDGKSDAAFRKLIFLERLMISQTFFYDLRASWYQRRGVPVLKDEFVPMIALPEIDPDAPAPSEEIKNIPWKDYRKEIRSLILKRDRNALLAKSLEIIHEMEKQKDYWCLTRHLVESIYRVAWFLPERIKASQEKIIRSPENLLWGIMKYHLVGFPHFVKVDRLAAPVQKAGIPMICSELPDLLSDLK